MQFRDLHRQYDYMKNDIDKAIEKVITQANFISGEQVLILEKELADYIGVRHCITCANGTDALQIALMTLGVGQGDAVFVPDFTFFSSGEVVPLVGASPIFVDVCRDTYNIDCDALERMIQMVLEEGSLIPKALIAVDLFGQPAEYGKLREIANKYNILIIEDGAQGFGGRIKTFDKEYQMACSFGDISTTSFFPAKPLGCYGDGGAIFTNNDEWAAMIRSLCVHGKGENKYDNIRIGLNSRLDTVQAALLSVKLRMFINHEFDAVNQVANWYGLAFKKINANKYNGSNPLVLLPTILDDYLSSWAQYSIVLKETLIRDEIQMKLRENGIPSMVYYAKPMHRQVAFEGLVNERYLNDKLFVNTYWLCDRVLSLPIHPYLLEEEIDLIVNNILQILY